MKAGPIPRWSFDLCRSSDLSVIEPLRDATTRSLSLFFDHPGSFSATMPIDSDAALKASELSTCIVATARLFNDDGSLKQRVQAWSGLVTNINDTCPDDTTQITALGWFEELEHRYLERQVTYTNMIGGQIGVNLLALANNKIDSLSRPQPSHILAGSFADTQIRTRTYQQGQSIGAAIRELSEVENGYDFDVDPTTRFLSFQPPSPIVDRPNVLLGYRAEPFNLSGISRSSDATKTRNRIMVQGSTGTAIQDDPAAIDAVGLMMEDFISISDVPNLDTLNAYAGAELAFSAFPQQVLSFKVAKASAVASKVPVFLRDFDLGDKVYLSANRGRLQVRGQACRAFGVDLTFDTEGNQTLDNIAINFSS